ncbi:MAG TPA: sodium:solute symporter [Niabella sp.]
MSAGILFSIVIAYFFLLLFVAWKTGKNSNNESFFIGNRNSNWMLVAFGMIGTSLSGVTFVSVPGAVGKDAFGYMQVVLGYMIGYLLIAYVLLPLYYRLQLTSIYGYLKTRMGNLSYKTGAWFFIISRLVGATARLYLVVHILQITILDSFGVPFWASTLIILVMIILYTFEGGVKTIVWTDTLQTTCMLLGLVICTVYLLQHMNISVGESLDAMHTRRLSKIFNTNVNSSGYFIKQILAGMFITLSMTGIDQEMMQKSISVTNLKDSRKNMISLAFIMVAVIGLFLYLGGLLHLFAAREHLNAQGDALFPDVAINHMPAYISIIFIVALISALFPSADGAMTALTSSFCIDIAGLQRRADMTEPEKKKFRQKVHLLVALSFLILVMVFYWINDNSMIGIILKLAGYTYGPLLGLFAFGIFTKRRPDDRWVPVVCFIAPVICFFIDYYTNEKGLFGNFKIGLELILINAALTFIGLLIISKPVTDISQLEQGSAA